MISCRAGVVSARIWSGREILYSFDKVMAFSNRRHFP
jgi:hypothetical protein